MLCSLCPRNCRAERGAETGAGFCAAGTLPRVARCAPHFWEEPCLSGTRGAGAVFFTGCQLRCVYCQNGAISRGGAGKTVTVGRLRAIYGELIAQGVHNIDLVTPTHFLDAVLASLTPALPVPVVWNSSAYESVASLQRLEGKVQVYLPDMKYADPAAAARYSAAPDYPEVAEAAIREMVRQTGPVRLGSDGLLQSGVIIRHLILPGNLDNTLRVIEWAAGAFRPGEVLFSLMSQYTPCGDLAAFPELQRRISPEEYDAAVSWMELCGLRDGYCQELSSAKEEYTPPFDLTGV